MHRGTASAGASLHPPPAWNLGRCGYGAVGVLLVALLSGCFIPDDFDLEIDVPNAGEAGWKYNGKWQFFFAGYDPRREVIPPNDVIGLTAELAKLPGSTSVTHVEKNIWKQSIAWKVRLRDSQNRPTAVLFPTSTAPTGGGPEYWLVRIVPEAGNSVLLETVAPPTGPDLAAFVGMGYKSSGTLTIKTTGTVMQLGGPQLSKSWFGGSYSAKWGLFQGPPIKLRIKW
jgi:hypothetical protein